MIPSSSTASRSQILANNGIISDMGWRIYVKDDLKVLLHSKVINVDTFSLTLNSSVKSSDESRLYSQTFRDYVRVWCDFPLMFIWSCADGTDNLMHDALLV